MFRFRSVLKLEALDARDVPSAVTLSKRAHLDSAPALAHHHYALAGHGTGSYATDEVSIDTGNRYHFAGTARVADLGQVNVVGSASGVGFIRRGHAHGSLTLSNARGSVTLELIGLPEQDGFSMLPQYFRYRITAGTGEFQHLQEHGTLRVDLQPIAAGPVTNPLHGTFRIAI